MNKLFIIGAAVAVCGAAMADGEWSSRAPLQDTFVRDSEPNANFGSNGGIITGNNREGCMMFDVSGLANVTAARIRFYVTQCGTEEVMKWPLYFRIMRNDRWNESTLTWNMLPDEFRVATPILATNDVTLAGYVEVSGGSLDTWQEVEVTDAVKAAAPRGRLALHVYTYNDANCGTNCPLSFASSDRSDATLRPVLEFQGAVDNSASTLTLLPTADTFIKSGDATDHGSSDYVIVDSNGKREGFLKFDLSGINASSVDSAVLLVHMDTQNDYSAGNNIEFRLTDKTDWNENGVTWANSASTTGITPGGSWAAETPANAVRGPSSAASKSYTIELAPLVNQVLAAGKTTMSLNIWRNPSDSRFFIFYSKDYAVEAHRPRLLVTPKVDAPLTTRPSLQETFVGTGSGQGTAYFTWMLNRNPAWDYLQVGGNANMAQYGFMMFDPSGLENADYVRFRVLSHNNIAAGDGALRVAAWTTDAWNATNLTYKTLAPWFPSPVIVNAETEIPGEVANIGLTQSKGSSYFEVDVTAAARAAAAAGKMITFGLFSHQTWPEFYKGESPYPAVIIFPDPDATFGSYVHASLDRSGETPALRLTWAPGAASGETYTVERMEKGVWKTVATDLSAATCLDAQAKPYETHTYRITETTSGESVTKTFDFEPEVKVMTCADTFVFSGSKDSQHGTETSIVHKYEQSTSGIREGFYRFDLSEVPENFKTATLKFYSTGPDEYYSGNELFWVLTYPDFEWTDANAPSWNDVFDNEWSTPQARGNHPDSKRPLEGQVNTVGDVTSRLLGGEVFEYDVASIIQAAKAKGDSHITFHTCAYDPEGQWNFGIIPRERAQGLTQAAQIVFTLKNWVQRGTMIVVR